MKHGICEVVFGRVCLFALSVAGAVLPQAIHAVCKEMLLFSKRVVVSGDVHYYLTTFIN